MRSEAESVAPDTNLLLVSVIHVYRGGDGDQIERNTIRHHTSSRLHDTSRYDLRLRRKVSRSCGEFILLDAGIEQDKIKAREAGPAGGCSDR